MSFLDINDFTFQLPGYPPGGLGALPFYFPCQPVSVGVGEKVPVRVQVKVSVGVSELVVTVQQATVQVPTTVSLQNPVRQNQPVSVGQEVTVGTIPTNGNPTLEEFAKNGSSIGTTIFVPQGVQVDKYIKDMWQHLGRRIGAEVATDVELSKTLAGSSDEFAQMADKLKRTSPAQAQQILQRAGVPFDKARQIAQNAAIGASDEAARGLKEALSRTQSVTVLRDLINFQQISQAVGC